MGYYVIDALAPDNTRSLIDFHHLTIEHESIFDKYHLKYFRDYCLSILINQIFANYSIYAFKFSPLDKIRKLRSHIGLFGRTTLKKEEFIQKEYIIDGIDKSIFIGILKCMTDSPKSFPNVGYCIHKDSIVDDKTLDYIAELIIENGLNNITYNLIAKELKFTFALSQYIDSPTIGLWAIDPQFKGINNIIAMLNTEIGNIITNKVE